MTTHRLKKPCNECPWRKKSWAGWLGDSSPESFLASQQVLDMPCHKSVDYADPAWAEKLDEAATCVGGLQFLNNSITMPYGPDAEVTRERMKDVGKNDDVFQWGRDFLEHHHGGDFKSWES